MNESEKALAADNTLTVVAEIKAKTGKAGLLREVLKGLVAPTRQENGCLTYALHESAEHPGTFLFYENWSGKARLDCHLQSPHLQQFFARVPELVEGDVKISLWRPEP